MNEKKDNAGKKVRWAPPKLNVIPDLSLEGRPPEEKKAFELFAEGCRLYDKDIDNDLNSPQAEKNRQAMALWQKSADLGFIKAMEVIARATEEGGFVKEPENNYGVNFWGQNMGLNPEGESGWLLMRRYCEMAIDAGADDLSTFGNDPRTRENIYTLLARTYGDDEVAGTAPEILDYDKCYHYYSLAAQKSFKANRYIAELYLYGRIAPPEGRTSAEMALEHMKMAVETRDATASFYLGLWYLNDGSEGIELPPEEGETKYQSAVRYLENGMNIADHGTMRKCMEGLLRLAQVYATGEGALEVPKDTGKAIAVYDKMLSEHFYPGNKDFTEARDRLVNEETTQADDSLVIHPGQGKIIAGKEKILFADREWLILEETEDAFLIMAAHNIGKRSYHSSFTQVTWETSDMRKWLNTDYLEKFPTEDKIRIMEIQLANPYNTKALTYAGVNTVDKIFLLSLEEVMAYSGEELLSDETWWLRTPGGDQRYQIMVKADGSLNNYGWRITNPYGAVRPAMWIRR